MIYKVVSVFFAMFALFQALLFSKSVTLFLTRKSNAYMSIMTVPCALWAIFTVISLCGWWSIAALPIFLGLVMMVFAAFVHHVRASGLIEAQFGYGFFMLLFTALSVLPYALKWIGVL